MGGRVQWRGRGPIRGGGGGAMGRGKGRGGRVQWRGGGRIGVGGGGARGRVRGRAGRGDGGGPGAEDAGPDLDSAWVGRVRDRLMAWYERGHRDLPWRRERDPYRILVSE